jgi:hypothetical protein
MFNSRYTLPSSRVTPLKHRVCSVGYSKRIYIINKCLTYATCFLCIEEDVTRVNIRVLL